MYKEQWAAIVYGRSYHLDFRLIALPEDFAEPEIDWVLPHILATTQKPKKLSLNPRWSLFKNQYHCVVGVTCMVRDLLHGKEMGLTRDDKERPLYIFVGYITKLTSRRYLRDLPPYNNNSLHDFQNLYDYVRQVWLVKDFHKNSHQYIKTNYKTREFSPKSLENNLSKDLIVKLNHQAKNPDQVFLWQDKLKRNSQLWATAAVTSQSTSLCIGSKNLEHCLNSPFLNQTIESQEILTIRDRLNSKKSLESKEKSSTKNKTSFPKLFINKVKQDIETTRNSALQLQQIILENNSEQPETNLMMFEDGIYQDFGFKNKVVEPQRKVSESPIIKSDWF